MTMPIMDAEATERLARMLVALKHSTERDAVRYRRTESNRVNMLLVHAVAALLIAPAFAASHASMTGPNWVYLLKVPGFPYSFAVLLWLGGLILLPATVRRERGWEMLGLAMISYWYLALSVGFAIPTVLYLVNLAAGAPTGRPPSFYAWCVYMHLMIVMRVHIFTLWRMRRSGRPDIGEV